MRPSETQEGVTVAHGDSAFVHPFGRMLISDTTQSWLAIKLQSQDISEIA